ncbi:hypothetical protein Dimus_027165, partial [Dionaea muscipula]
MIEKNMKMTELDRSIDFSKKLLATEASLGQKIDNNGERLTSVEVTLASLLKAQQERNTMNKALTDFLVSNFLGDSKKGESSGGAKEQKGSHQHISGSYKGGFLEHQDKGSSRIVKSSAEVLSAKDMEDFNRLFKDSKWPKHVTKQDALCYFCEVRKRGESLMKVVKSKKKGYKGRDPTQMECTEEFENFWRDESFQ